MTKIDLRFKNEINKEYADLLNKISREKISEFHNFISKISNDNKNNLDWWFSSASSRYTLASPLYYNFCITHLLKYILKTNKNVSIIIVDNIEIKKVFNKLILKYKKKIKVISKFDFINFIFSRISNIKSILKQFVYRIIQLLICRIYNQNLSNVKNNKIVVIDKYIFPDYINEERYYIGLIKNLKIKEKKLIYFVPTIVMFNISSLFNVYKKLYNSNDKYIFKENFINLSDIIYAIFHFYRKKNIVLLNNYVCDVEFSKVIRNELKNNLISYVGAVESFLTIKFIMKLKKLNFNVKTSIDWFENQIMDRGWNYGFNKYFPNINIIGYRGLVPSDLLLSEMYPTEDEEINNMLPKKIYVIGEGFKKDIKTYIKKTKIDIAPAFRFQHIWSHKYQPNKNIFTIFIALPINFDESLNILNLFIKTFNNLIKYNFNIIIKPHPTISINDLKNSLKYKIPNSFKILKGNTEKIIVKSNILISGMSSICLEGIAIGIPLIIIKNEKRLFYKALPKNMSSKLYSYCSSPDDLLNEILNIKNMKKNKIKLNLIESKKIKNKYFKKIDRKSIKSFLNLD